MDQIAAESNRLLTTKRIKVFLVAGNSLAQVTATRMDDLRMVHRIVQCRGSEILHAILECEQELASP